ncbi:helix-turn-helix domain-containing protein [Saccharothrix algeriensis]|uniref:Helix-turn-helix domain-containing protein n=1 Tax=Saccharothrix algeriensis TaxID=173560 RepID=A0A8T8I4I1_9PSEU|nr:helix-turn-helix transcriptional regulator [Saccharothrix algeriensis]MBM7811968.1 transcriptional regulator with XRE-family HTH domain [Saccharothrix algeriensis]QTR05666.1 helix-turn-helix domain-containing protein [Saccharothrix algeriensis]
MTLPEDGPDRLPEWPLGPYLREARRLAGLSVAEVARLAEVSHAKVRQLERGYAVRDGRKYAVGTTKTTVERVARVVGADVGHALGLVGISADDPSGPGRRARPLDLSAVSDEDLLTEIARRFGDRHRAR